jgi:hypothetical protein
MVLIRPTPLILPPSRQTEMPVIHFAGELQLDIPLSSMRGL